MKIKPRKRRRASAGDNLVYGVMPYVNMETFDLIERISRRGVGDVDCRELNRLWCVALEILDGVTVGGGTAGLVMRSMIRDVERRRDYTGVGKVGLYAELITSVYEGLRQACRDIEVTVITDDGPAVWDEIEDLIYGKEA